MQVILLERIRKLGQMGDIVTVKDGFARNFLLPFGKALHATPSNMERFEDEKADIEARNVEMKNEADQVSTKLDGKEFTVIRQASDTGHLFGSVSTRDVVQNVKEDGFIIERRQVLLDNPIKTLGIYPITIALHGDVDCTISINVARSDEEAVRQARGEDILAEDQDDLEETVELEEVFEDEDKAKEAADDLADEEPDEADKPTGAAPAETARTEESGSDDAGDDAAEEKPEDA